MKGRVLILGTGHISTNPRALKEAITLSQAGYSVSVIGKRYVPAWDSLDLEFARKSPFGYQYIDMIGGRRSSPSHIIGMLRRMRTRFARGLVKYFHLENAEALGPAAALLRAAREIPSDLVIVHNEAAQWAGLQLIAEERRVAVDFEDWNSEDMLPNEQLTRPLALLRRNEQALLHKAVYATTTSEALADGLFARYGGQRPSVVTNSFLLPPLPKRTLRTDNARPPSFFWFSQTIGPGRGLEAFLAAYVLTQEPSRLTFLGEVKPDYRAHLISLLPQGLRSRIDFHELVPPDELPELISLHDIGLALEQAQPLSRNLTITNKILQYLGSGLAVVATPTRGQREAIARSPEAGIILENLDNSKTTAAALDALLADRPALRARQLAARQLAETHYCWEREAPKLLALVERALRL